MDAGGKSRADILFTAHSNGTKMFLATTGICYQFEKTTFPEGYQPLVQKGISRKLQKELSRQIKKETYRFSLLLQGANALTACGWCQR